MFATFQVFQDCFSGVRSLAYLATPLSSHWLNVGCEYSNQTYRPRSRRFGSKRSPFGALNYTSITDTEYQPPVLERCPGPVTADAVCPLSSHQPVAATANDKRGPT